MKYKFGLEPIDIVDDIFKDGIARVELYDFSRANLNKETRLHAITSVASICYQNPNAVDKQSLMDRLASESKGLPSSSFEFVPVLINSEVYENRVLKELKSSYNPLTKFGIWIKDFGNKTFLLTNYRAIVTLFELTTIDLRELFNTEEECEIIGRYFCTYKVKIDTNTRTQLIRHRTFNYQELSRRYVSGKRLPISFYVSDDIKNKSSRYIHKFDNETNSQTLDFTTEDIHKICLNHYEEMLKQGVKPQSARRVLPQSMYTDLWIGTDRRHLNSFFKLRMDKSAQYEIRCLSHAMCYLSLLKVQENLENNISQFKKEIEKIKSQGNDEAYVNYLELTISNLYKELEHVTEMTETKGKIKK